MFVIMESDLGFSSWKFLGTATTEKAADKLALKKAKSGAAVVLSVATNSFDFYYVEGGALEPA